MALLGVIVKDQEFYDLAQEGATISIDLTTRQIFVKDSAFDFELSRMEQEIIQGGGVTNLYKKHGRRLFQATIEASQKNCATDTACTPSEISW